MMKEVTFLARVVERCQPWRSVIPRSAILRFAFYSIPYGSKSNERNFALIDNRLRIIAQAVIEPHG